MKICISYGVHPNEYTEPYAKAVASILEREHAVHIEMVPFEMTGWGAALQGKKSKEIKKALGYSHIPNVDFDYFLEFHSTGMPECYLSAKDLGFQFVPKVGQNHFEGEPGVFCVRYESEEFTNYILELPQVDRPIPDGFQKLFKRRCALFDDAQDDSNLRVIIEQYFTNMADKIATKKRYPPEIVSKVIVGGIERYILTD